MGKWWRYTPFGGVPSSPPTELTSQVTLTLPRGEGSSVDVFVNHTRLVEDVDFVVNEREGVVLLANSGAQVGDHVEVVIHVAHNLVVPPPIVLSRHTRKRR